MKHMTATQIQRDFKRHCKKTDKRFNELYSKAVEEVLQQLINRAMKILVKK